MHKFRRASTGSFKEDGKKQTSILSFLTKRENRYSDDSMLTRHPPPSDSSVVSELDNIGLKTPPSHKRRLIEPPYGLLAATMDTVHPDNEETLSEDILDRKRLRQAQRSQLFESDEEAMEDIDPNKDEAKAIEEADVDRHKCSAFIPSTAPIASNVVAEHEPQSTLNEKPPIAPLHGSLNGLQFDPHPRKRLQKDVREAFSLTDLPNVKREVFKGVQNTGKPSDLSREDLKHQMLDCFAAKAFPSFNEYVEHYYTYCDAFSFPIWVDPSYIRDSKLCSPFDSNYDYTTLWVPPASHKYFRDVENRPHLTPGMVQYWDIKAKQFDRLIFFKMGRFYELFYVDACIAQRICDLKWMGAEQKPHVGFPEQSLHYYANKLVKRGYKVVVVEQMETPKELEERNKQSVGPKDKAVRREICESFSQGTILHSDMLGTDAQYLMAVYFDELEGATGLQEDATVPSIYNFGMCMVDVATCQFFLGYFSDNSSRLTFRTLLAQTGPSEVIYSASNVSTEALQILRNLANAPQLSPMVDFPIGFASTVEFERYGEGLKQHSQLDKLCASSSSLLNAFAAVCRYLKRSLLDEKVFAFARFDRYEPFNQKYMILDVTALKNLEVLETNEAKKDNSLFDFLDHTSTAFGSRVFKRWVCSPLYSIDEINRRLDCVEWFRDNEEVVHRLRKKLKRLPDVERLFSHVCIRGLQSERGAVYFDNVHHKRLEEFVLLLEAFDTMQEILRNDLGSLYEASGTAFPARLVELVCSREAGGICPSISAVNSQLRNQIDLSDRLKPKQGVDDAYDCIESRIRLLNHRLEKELEHLRHSWKQPSLKFVHTKFRFEIECLDTLPEAFQRTVDITSTKKGFIRFQTEAIKTLVSHMEVAEQNLKDAIFPFMQKLFQQFYSFYHDYQLVMRIIAEIDSLLSLTMVCISSAEGMCRPKFVPHSNDRPFLSVRNCRHPIVASTIHNFIANDTIINTDELQASTLLVTGPNMGGKSTVLRQTCIAIIMAQIGGYVAADECTLSPVDRIFTRIGANDSILEGKSTFFVELEETCTILKHASVHSFAIIDELGRGTSTFDGTAIAMASLEYIASRVQCRCMFATHFHLLCEEFRLFPMIRNFHMAAEVDNVHGSVTFLYKFVEGACPKSHGIRVAQLAGIPQSILDCAAHKSIELEMVTKEFHTLSHYRNVAKQIIECIEAKDDAGLQQLYHQYVHDFQ